MTMLLSVWVLRWYKLTSLKWGLKSQVQTARHVISLHNTFHFYGKGCVRNHSASILQSRWWGQRSTSSALLLQESRPYRSHRNWAGWYMV